MGEIRTGVGVWGCGYLSLLQCIGLIISSPTRVQWSDQSSSIVEGNDQSLLAQSDSCS